jgi:hypothetical protein
MPLLALVAVGACLLVPAEAQVRPTKPAEPPPQGSPSSYLPVVVEKSFEEIQEADRSAKPQFDERQRTLLERRYDLRNDPSDVPMSAGRKQV